MRRMYAARTVITISILLITFTVTACQPTPDNPIVADKNMENMIDSAKETQTSDAVNESLRDKVSSPETFVYNDTQGKLTITANADVFVPDVAKHVDNKRKKRYDTAGDCGQILGCADRRRADVGMVGAAYKSGLRRDDRAGK